MATSGITTLSLTRDQLVTAALRKLGVVAQGQTPDAEAISNGAQALNLRIAQFRKKGLHLWKRKTHSFAPTASVASYLIGASQTLNTAYPLHLIQAYKTISSGTTKIPMEIISDWNYNRLPSGSTTGAPIQITYQPQIAKGTIKLWPTPDATAASTTTITIIYFAPVEVFTGASETLDMPEEWYLPLVYYTAVDLAPEWGVPLQERQMLNKEAEKLLENAEEFSGEDASLYFQIEHR